MKERNSTNPMKYIFNFMYQRSNKRPLTVKIHRKIRRNPPLLPKIRRNPHLLAISSGKDTFKKRFYFFSRSQNSSGFLSPSKDTLEYTSESSSSSNDTSESLSSGKNMFEKRFKFLSLSRNSSGFLSPSKDTSESSSSSKDTSESLSSGKDTFEKRLEF